MLLESLLDSTKSGDVRRIVDLLIEEHGAKWLNVGGRESNLPTIHMSGNPVAAAVERLTNAIDATLELHAQRSPELMSSGSPREFVDKAFGATGGHLTKIDKGARAKLADTTGIIIRLVDGDSDSTPTIDFRDAGIGLYANEYANTIVSLNRSNKITKWYLMGRFGQGGSTAFRFSTEAIIASKKNDAPDAPVAFTVVLHKPPERGEKDGRYLYLVGPDDMPFEADNPTFTPGTLVRHINYNFSKNANTVSIYGWLEGSLFDPVLPFTLDECRRAGKYKNQARKLSGSRARLDTSDHVEISDEYVVPLADPADGDLIIRYWLLKAGSDNIETFVEKTKPIVVTYLGQTQDTLTKHLIGAECKLGYLDKGLIVQVDCESLTDEGRRKFFTSTRERITDEGRDLVTDALIKTLKEDDALNEANERRKMDSIKSMASKDTTKLRQRLAEMINRIRPGSFKIPASTKGKGEGPRKPRPGSRVTLPPLPTNDFPTFIKIANHEDPIDFTKGERRTIVVHSDAPDGFLLNEAWTAKIQLTSPVPPPAKIVTGHRDFKGGRLHLRLELEGHMKEGDEFSITLQMTATDKSGNIVSFSDTRKCIVEQPSTSTPTTAAFSDAPNPIAVEVGDDVWVQEKFSDKTVAEVKETASGMDIFVSIGNTWYVGTVSRYSKSESTVEKMKTRYLLNVAFHTYLQYTDENLEAKVDADVLEEIRQGEKERMARTVLTAITSAESLADDE